MLAAAALLVPSAAAGSAPPNPCALLSNAEVGAALASKVVDRTATGNRLYRECTWTGANLSKPGFLATRRTLMLTVSPGTRAQFLRFANRVQGAIRVRGVGELAFGIEQAGDRLEAYDRGYVVEVVATFVSSPLAVEKRLAKTAVARL